MMRLSEIKAGEKVWIISVGGEAELRRRLFDMGLIPGTAVTVSGFAPLGNPMEITVRGYRLTLRLEDAHGIEVAGSRQQG